MSRSDFPTWPYLSTMCKKSVEFPPRHRQLEASRQLIEENHHHPHADPRLAQWLVLLGRFLKKFMQENEDEEDWEQDAIKCFKLAGKLGLGAGYYHLSSIYMDKANWNEAKRYLQMAADLYDVNAIYGMGYDAGNGCMDPRQESNDDPDFEVAFRWYQTGAQLDDARCCAMLGSCYNKGYWIQTNLTKGFKWSKKAAEMGNPSGMRDCAEYYIDGVQGVVEQSIEQAIYWLEKSLEVEENEVKKDQTRERTQDLLRGSSREARVGGDD